jgi:hypothetical protein
MTLTTQIDEIEMMVTAHAPAASVLEKLRALKVSVARMEYEAMEVKLAMIKSTEPHVNERLEA